MRSLVHGPVAVVADDLDVPHSIDSSVAQWIEGVGLLLVGSSQMWVVDLNGVCAKISDRVSWYGLGWTYDDFLAVSYGIGSGSRWSRMIVPATAPVGSSYTNPLVGSYAVLKDRLIRFSSGRVYRNDFNSSDGSLEKEISNDVGAASGLILPYDLSRDLWWLVAVNGAVFLYDATSKAEVVGRRTSFGPGTLRSVGYSRKHKLFFVLRGTNSNLTMEVWSDESTAASISAPTLDIAPVRAGMRRVVRSRVLGSDGEPCVDRSVRFQATVGTVDREVVRTDEEGWAETNYLAPLAPSLGVMVTATLEE